MSTICKAGTQHSNGREYGHDTSDHFEEILELKQRAVEMYKLADVLVDYPQRHAQAHNEALTLTAAAAILDVHDETGIVLDDWIEVRDWIEALLGKPITESRC